MKRGSGRWPMPAGQHGCSGVQARRPRLDLLEVHDVISIVTTTEPVHAAFEQFAYNVWRRTKFADEQTRTLAALRDALLPKLMSGELRVKDAERFLAGTLSVPSEVVT